MYGRIGFNDSVLRPSDPGTSCRGHRRIGTCNPESRAHRPGRWITTASSSSKGGSSARNPQKAYRISSVGQSVLDTLVDVEVGDSARQEAETWRSLQQFSSNALELTQKRLQSDGYSEAACLDPAVPTVQWLKRLWPWGRHGLLEQLGELNGKLLYSYFNWRQDTSSDLQLFAILSVTLVVTGGLLKGSVIKFFDALLPLNDVSSADAWWRNFYQVGLLLFGENFPPATDPPAEQVFSLVTASIGLASFALILALVEQVVLEVIEEQVARGSRIYESGHFVVLVWGNSQRDLEAVERILSQVCQAHRADGGRVVVVMSQREKLDMESLYRRQIPPEQRHGSSFVFRQGSPLDITDLRDVSVSSAAAVIVLADNSRSPEDADAQALRAAVILDELDFPGWGMADPRTAAIIVELKTPQAVPLLRYSTSKRILALPTSLLNARRVARMVTSPISATVSRNVWNFKSHAQNYMQQFPQLVGIPFGDLHRYFDDGTPYGLVNMRTGACSFNPSNKTIITADDLVVMNRPSEHGKAAYQPLEQPVSVDLGNWTRRHWARNHGQEGRQFASHASMDDDGSIQLRAPAETLSSRQRVQQRRQAELQQHLAQQDAAAQAAQAERRRATRAAEAAQQMQLPGSHTHTQWPAPQTGGANGGSPVQPSLFRYIEAEQQSRAAQPPPAQHTPAEQRSGKALQGQPSQQQQQRQQRQRQQEGEKQAPANEAGRGRWDAQSQRGLGKEQQPLARRQASQRISRAPASSWDDPSWSGPGARPGATAADPVKRWPSQLSGYDSEDPTWSGIGPRPAKRQAYSADAAGASTGGAAGGQPGSAEQRWAALIGTTRSRVAEQREADAAAQLPQAPASGLKPAVRTALGEAAGAHDQCSANAVGNAVIASQASTADAGVQNPAAAAGSSTAARAGGAGSAATAGRALGAPSSNDSGSSGGATAKSSSSGNGSGGAPTNAMPWTYDYMLFILPRQYTGWSYTERVLLCGWGETQFMADLLAELDHGPSALPPGSSVTLLNSRPTAHIMSFLEGRVNTQNISVGHVSGDPRQPAHLRSRLRLAAFSSAIVLCDVVWTDPDPYDGVDEIDRRSDVRLLDSLIMTVQLNIRKLLQEEGCPDINIICERITVGGLPTRFEDQTRLPMGVSVNSTSYSAKLLQAAAYDPGMLAPMLFGDGHATHTYVQDAEALAAPGEQLSWWQLMGRARTVGQVLLGYFEVPFNMDDPVTIAINPTGDATRSAMRVWNREDLRTKLVVLGPPLGPNADRRNEVQRFALRTRGDEAALPILSTTVRSSMASIDDDDPRPQPAL